MTVSEMITALQALPQDKRVLIFQDNFSRELKEFVENDRFVFLTDNAELTRLRMSDDDHNAEDAA